MHPQREDYWGHVNPIGPRGCYDEAKRFAEAITMAYHRYHGVKTRIVRIFNTYGPRMRLNDGRVLPNFMGQALRGEPITVYGNGDQTRSFCYVSDLVEGIYRLLTRRLTRAGQPRQSRPRSRSCNSPQEIIALVEGTKSTIVYEELPEDDPEAPPARHHQGPDAPRLEPCRGSPAGPAPNPRVFPVCGLTWLWVVGSGQRMVGDESGRVSRSSPRERLGREW